MKGPFTVLPMVNIASIDLGSHTARLLISRVGESGELLVSMSDLLEGALMDFFEGEQHG